MFVCTPGSPSRASACFFPLPASFQREEEMPKITFGGDLLLVAEGEGNYALV